MSALLSIGQFARVSHLSVKTLRHYDEIGLLEPAEVDPWSSRRRYVNAQIPVAHLIRRFREMDMPLEQICRVLDAPDLNARNQVIIEHLERMRKTLDLTRKTVASLTTLLSEEGPSPFVQYRHVETIRAVTITETIEWSHCEQWLKAALDELADALGPDPAPRADAAGTLCSPELFQAHTGQVVAFVPINADWDEPINVGRVAVADIPAANLAVMVHRGSLNDIDRTYGALGSIVIARALDIYGPIREHYLIADADDATACRTEVCWPIRAFPHASNRSDE